MKNPYEVLEIDKEKFDEKELKKKYKRLCVKWHPDKFATKSPEEQKEAEEKFKEINEAYQVLSDPEKKKMYDMYGDINPRAQHHSTGGFQDEMAQAMWEAVHGRHRRRKEPTGNDIRMKVPLTLEELIKGTTKKLRFRREVRCSQCHGAGGSGQEVCPHCDGTGMIIESYRQGNTLFQSQHTCPHCNGTGIFTKYKCEKCSGSGFEIKYNIVEVHFEPGLQEGEYIVVQGEGSEASRSQYKNGNFICIITHAYDKEKYVVEGLDVFEKVQVPYVKAILGETVEINHPSEGKIKIKLDECTAPNEMKVLSGKGMPRAGYNTGDYGIIVEYNLPNKLTEKEKETLKKLL